MTDATTTQTSSRTAGSTSPTGAGAPLTDDPRAPFASAVALADGVIAAVEPGQLDDPTPCDGFTVRRLLGHVGDVMARIELIGRGGDPLANGQIDPTAVADDGWLDLFRERAAEAEAAWTDDASLEREVVLPWLTTDGAGALASYISELTVHTWDLATATGQHPAWDDRVVEVAFGAISHGLPASGRLARFEAIVAQMPPEIRPTTPPFAEAVEVPAGAAPIDALVAWTGRPPSFAA